MNMQPRYNLSAIATSSTLLASLAINTLNNSGKIGTSTDIDIQVTLLDSFIAKVVTVYVAILVTLFLAAVIAFLRKKRELGIGLLLSVFFSILTVAAISTSFSSTDYIYLPVIFALSAFAGHALKWESVRDTSLVALGVTFISVVLTRLWMYFY